MQNQDKKISYLPPEWGKNVIVNFYKNLPAKIDSSALKDKEQVLIVYDETLPKEYLRAVEEIIAEYKVKAKAMPLDPSGKSLQKVNAIWSSMIAVHPDIAIALGGGTICDMVGFASSCYHRGISHIFFPTTLLSMVDASIGGKTGIDYRHVKNSIGMIHYAQESFCFFPFLKTLDYPELISGFSEVIKAGMLFDSQLISQIEKLHGSFQIDNKWFSVISRSAELKALMSEKPLSERSRLLYGHNIGHAIETYDHTHRRHGDCVSIGMNMELALAVVAGIVEMETWNKQHTLLRKFKLHKDIPQGINFKTLKEKMKRYKLYKDKQFLYIIPKKPGSILESSDSYYWKLTEEQLDQLLPKAAQLLDRMN